MIFKILSLIIFLSIFLCGCKNTLHKEDLQNCDVINSFTFKKTLSECPSFFAEIAILNSSGDTLLIDANQQYILDFVNTTNYNKEGFFVFDNNYDNTNYSQGFCTPVPIEYGLDSLKKFEDYILKFIKREDTLHYFNVNNKKYIKIFPKQKFISIKIFEIFDNDYNFILDHTEGAYLGLNYLVMNKQKKLEQRQCFSKIDKLNLIVDQ